MRPPPCLVYTKSGIVWHGAMAACARDDDNAAATRRLGVTSGTGAAAGRLFASGAKAPAAGDEQT